MYIKDVDEYIKSLEKMIDELKEKNDFLTGEILHNHETINMLTDSHRHIHPTRLIHTKSRGNTTIIFHDGSSETVHLKKGEKDSLDTAVAYALIKHVYPKAVIKDLIKRVEEN